MGEAWNLVGTFIGGGAAVAFLESLRRMYATRTRRLKHQDTLADAKDSREADASRSILLDANAERRATLEKVNAQADKITELSVQVARCVEKHAASEAREMQQKEEIKRLTTALDMTQQLVAAQRVKLAEQDETIVQQGAVIAQQGRELESLHADMASLKASFDAFVAKSLGISRVSEIPGG